MRSYSVTAPTTAATLAAATGGTGTTYPVSNRLVITIQNPSNATFSVAVGGADVAHSPQAGVVLVAGQSYTIEGKRPVELYLVSEAGGTQVVGVNVHYAAPT